MGLVGEAEAEEGAQEGVADMGVEEEENAFSRKFHSTVMSGKLWQAVHQAPEREEGGGAYFRTISAPRLGKL